MVLSEGVIENKTIQKNFWDPLAYNTFTGFEINIISEIMHFI